MAEVNAWRSHMSRLLGRGMLALIVLSQATSHAYGNPWKDMLQSLPAEANAVALIDLEQLRKAASSKKTADEVGPIVERIDSIIPSSFRRIVMAASIDLDTLEPDWEVAVGNTTKSRSIEEIAKNQSGYIDDVEGERVVWSRRGYIWTIDPSNTRILRPANRRLMAKWIRGKEAFPVTPAIADAIERPHDHDALFLALDFVDAISQKAVRGRLESSELPGIRKGDFDRVAEAMAGIRLISLAASVDRGLHGRCRVEFSSAPPLTPEVWRAILVEVLERRGASLPDLASWNSRIQENSLLLSGPLSVDALEDILSFLSTPGALGRQEQSDSLAETSATEPQEQQELLATKSYFRSVKSIVDRVRKGSAQTQGQRAMWNDRAARDIDELPILHVDSAMLDYGANVAALLRGSGTAMREANLQAGASKARSSSGSDYYAVNDTAAYNAQLHAQARAKGTGEYLKNLEDIDNKTAAIRRAMTEKYKSEF